MRKQILALAAAALLTGCDGSYQSLPHALAALRAGDYDDFVAAEQESAGYVKKAIQPNADLCLAGPGNFFAYEASYAITRLKDKALFKLPEEDRFVYAMKIAGDTLDLPPGHFLNRAPIAGMTSSEDRQKCGGKQEQMAAAFTSGNDSGWTSSERIEVLGEWQRGLRVKYGGKFDEKMHDAAAHLDAVGYSAHWPADLL